ncbi:MAG: phosphoribosyltransferase [Anaerosporomusa subterranea]|nr:phosphoribosyltransferase [Anaerosporomusa subterranea]
MYNNRTHAGEILCPLLANYNFKNPCLLAVPRGGVVVAAPVAKALHVPIDVLVTRKIGHPRNAEVAIGAVMPDGSAILDDDMVFRLKLSEKELAYWIEAESKEIQRRLSAYTNSLELPHVKGRPTVIIDDGIATGYTIRAAIHWLRSQAPSYLAVAVPVAPLDVAESLSSEIDDLICPLQPADFIAVGMYYQQFEQTSESEVITILRDSHNKAFGY